ncbi:MAG: Nudix family hydrolase [Granulosicoccaceae bacterium]|jgi:8-oxo-dGTP diphosphatase
MATRLHVVAGVIVDRQGRVLVARRPQHVHQGGLWEFPGGKLEPGEAPAEGLRRELHEELGITVTSLRPLLRIAHDYPDKSVLLDVWRIDAFDGAPHGREGQPVKWLLPAELDSHDFPAANQPIVRAAQLPDRYLITPEPDPDLIDDFISSLDLALQRGIRLVQLRAHGLDDTAYIRLAKAALTHCREHDARLILNREPGVLEHVDADGLHLTTARLQGLTSRPVPHDKWLAASCHNRDELLQAARIGADFVVLAPVQATRSHPQITPLGWQRFAGLAEIAQMPVYALGGMAEADLETAWQHGAQGIAAIRGLWREPDN